MRLMRTQDVPIKAIMRRLGRTRGSVVAKLYQLRNVRQPQRRDFQPLVRKLVEKGQEDARIALKIGRSKGTIRYYRKVLGLRANKCSPWRQTSESHTRKRCMGCNILCPVAVGNGWTELTGWTAEVSHTSGATITVILCRKCSRDKESASGGRKTL